mmetsp:Transcript_8634/g.16734  ORF Transcript_8634/g.16734 Transcript_8634/m.16734 type:complete len:167 (+) Transcript_8634:710-1210(+)
MIRVQRKLTRLLMIGTPIWLVAVAATAFFAVRDLSRGSKPFSETHEENISKYDVAKDIGWWAAIAVAALFINYAWSPLPTWCVCALFTRWNATQASKASSSNRAVGPESKNLFNGQKFSRRATSGMMSTSQQLNLANVGALKPNTLAGMPSSIDTPGVMSGNVQNL